MREGEETSVGVTLSSKWREENEFSLAACFSTEGDKGCCVDIVFWTAALKVGKAACLFQRGCCQWGASIAQILARSKMLGWHFPSQAILLQSPHWDEPGTGLEHNCCCPLPWTLCRSTSQWVGPKVYGLPPWEGLPLKQKIQSEPCGGSFPPPPIA